MANGEVKYIVDGNGQPTGRISIQMDHIAHVIDVPQGMDTQDVITEFHKQYANKKAYERRIIANNTAKRRAEAAKAREDAIAGVRAMSDAEVGELVDSKKSMRLTFEGLEIDAEFAAAMEAPTAPKPVPAAKAAEGKQKVVA